MKRFLLVACLLACSALSVAAQRVTPTPNISSVTPFMLSSNSIYDMIITYGGSAGGSASYSRALHGTNLLADCGNGLTNSFFVFMTNNTWLTVTNVGWPNRVTFTFYNNSLNAYTLYTPRHPTTPTNAVLFGGDITAWTPSTNFSHVTAIGMSNNCVHALGQARGGGADW